MVLYHFHAKKSKKFIGQSNFWRMLQLYHHECTMIRETRPRLQLSQAPGLHNEKEWTSKKIEFVKPISPNQKNLKSHIDINLEILLNSKV